MSELTDFIDLLRHHAQYTPCGADGSLLLQSAFTIEQLLHLAERQEMAIKNLKGRGPEWPNFKSLNQNKNPKL